MKNNINNNFIFYIFFDILEKFKKLTNIFLLLFLLSFFPNLVSAEVKKLKIAEDQINKIVDKKVRDSFSYSGLASFYNGVSTYIFSENSIEKIKDKNFYKLNDDQNLV